MPYIPAVYLACRHSINQSKYEKKTKKNEKKFTNTNNLHIHMLTYSNTSYAKKKLSLEEAL